MVVTKTYYQCTFDFKDWVITIRSDKGIDAFRDGFWVNDVFEYTVGSDCLYWIPPSKIKYIEKVVEGVL